MLNELDALLSVTKEEAVALILGALRLKRLRGDRTPEWKKLLVVN